MLVKPRKCTLYITGLYTLASQKKKDTEKMLFIQRAGRGYSVQNK